MTRTAPLIQSWFTPHCFGHNHDRDDMRLRRARGRAPHAARRHGGADSPPEDPYGRNPASIEHGDGIP
jgi:hypothetical protein